MRAALRVFCRGDSSRRFARRAAAARRRAPPPATRGRVGSALDGRGPRCRTRPRTAVARADRPDSTRPRRRRHAGRICRPHAQPGDDGTATGARRPDDRGRARRCRPHACVVRPRGAPAGGFSASGGRAVGVRRRRAPGGVGGPAVDASDRSALRTGHGVCRARLPGVAGRPRRAHHGDRRRRPARRRRRDRGDPARVLDWRATPAPRPSSSRRWSRSPCAKCLPAQARRCRPMRSAWQPRVARHCSRCSCRRVAWPTCEWPGGTARSAWRCCRWRSRWCCSSWSFAMRWTGSDAPPDSRLVLGGDAGPAGVCAGSCRLGHSGRLALVATASRTGCPVATVACGLARDGAARPGPGRAPVRPGGTSAAGSADPCAPCRSAASAVLARSGRRWRDGGAHPDRPHHSVAGARKGLGQPWVELRSLPARYPTPRAGHRPALRQRRGAVAGRCRVAPCRVLVARATRWIRAACGHGGRVRGRCAFGGGPGWFRVGHAARDCVAAAARAGAGGHGRRPMGHSALPPCLPGGATHGGLPGAGAADRRLLLGADQRRAGGP